jgi:putative nucleotidyltransferase with HDIG domain
VSRRDEILARIQTVEALPVAAVKAVTLLQNPETDLCEIARLISHDPALAAGVLRLANSAAFGGRARIDSVEAAIARLGTRRTLNLVISSAVGPLEARPVRGYDLPAGELWRHNVAVALGTQALARLLKISAPESAFTAGLLVDIGKQVLGRFLEIDGGAIRDEAFERRVSFEQAEQNVLGIDHAEVGAALLANWGLPEGIVQVVRWHHDPRQCPAQYQSIAELVHAADQVCTQAGIGGGLDGSNYRPCETALDHLKLTTDTIERATCEIVERLAEMSDLFDHATTKG